MTEAEWLECDDLEQMLNFLHEKVSDRRCLLWVAAVYRFADATHGKPPQADVDLLDRYAEGATTLADLKQIWLPLLNDYARVWVERAFHWAQGIVWKCCNDVAYPPTAEMLPTFREIFGNPFRPVRLDPAWRTSTVLALAQGIYDERAFDRMPILADALQDAGCDNDDVLSHCRDPQQVHVRGCWVVDLVLGKE